jgi:hypothetical protein
MAEQRTLNPQVLGSNPRGRTTKPQVGRGFFTPKSGTRARVPARIAGASPSDKRLINFSTVDDREARFRAKVERRGDHDVWTGATDAKGSGLVRIDGRLRTVQRAAWEFAHGALSPGERVLACPDKKACVRIDHLRLADRRTPLGPPGARRRRGSGSMREIRPGVWRLTVSDGPGSDGQPRRRHRTVHGDEHDALEDLALLAETTNEPTRLGDLRVRELVDRYLCWRASDRNVARLRRLATARIEPVIGLEYATLVDGALIDGLLRRLRTEGAGDDEIRATYRLLYDTYAWARRRRWTNSTRWAT